MTTLPNKYVDNIIMPTFNGEISYPDIKQINATEYVLQKKYTTYFVYDNCYFKVTANPGFGYDGFSNIKILHGIQSPFTGLGTPASLLHDLDFCTHFTGGLLKSNWMFLVCLESCEVAWWKRNMMYVAVQARGWTVYYKPQKVTQANMKYVTITREQ